MVNSMGVEATIEKFLIVVGLVQLMATIAIAFLQLWPAWQELGSARREVSWELYAMLGQQLIPQSERSSNLIAYVDALEREPSKMTQVVQEALKFKLTEIRLRKQGSLADHFYSLIVRG